MLFSLLFGASAVCAIGPAALFCVNLRRFRPPPMPQPSREHPRGDQPSLSVLIPARNEEGNIGPALEHVLASRYVDLEVLILDDASTDRTAERVRAFAARDVRVRLLEGRTLPPGWNGKQHACWVLAQQASRPLLVFLDADVRIHADLLARMAAFRIEADAALVSGFPRLITLTWLEKLLLPLIHFVLLGFLPMESMRRSTRPSMAAGCGQFMFVERAAYFAAGGHKAIRETMHDGLLLPRAFRTAGFRTDLADITALAEVRMYDSAPKVWQGLAKNATEGIATPGKIVPLSLLLFLGQVLPALVCGLLLLSLCLRVLVGVSPATDAHPVHSRIAALPLAFLLVAIVGSYLPRLLAVRHFQQPLSSALLHPLGMLVLLALQWYAFGRKLIGKPVGWRQRTYSSGTGTEVRS